MERGGDIELVEALTDNVDPVPASRRKEERYLLLYQLVFEPLLIEDVPFPRLDYK